MPAEDAAMPEDDGDAILAQFGTHDFRGHREFSADLTRQFAEADGDPAPMWQLSCTLYWAPSPVTEVLASGHLWSFGQTLDAWLSDLGQQGAPVVGGSLRTVPG